MDLCRSVGDIPLRIGPRGGDRPDRKVVNREGTVSVGCRLLKLVVDRAAGCDCACRGRAVAVFQSPVDRAAAEELQDDALELAGSANHAIELRELSFCRRRDVVIAGKISIDIARYVLENELAAGEGRVKLQMLRRDQLNESIGYRRSVPAQKFSENDSAGTAVVDARHDRDGRRRDRIDLDRVRRVR